MASVLCLGDSITYGYTSAGQLAMPYPVALGTLLGAGYTVTNAGVSGNTTDQMRTRWDGGLKTGGYTHLVLLGGVNDSLADGPPDPTEANLEYMWSDAISRGMNVTALTIMPWKNETAGYWTASRQTFCDQVNSWIRARAAVLGVRVVDSFARMGGGQGGDPYCLADAYDSGDHIHPSQAGALFLAQIVSWAATASAGTAPFTGGSAAAASSTSAATASPGAAPVTGGAAAAAAYSPTSASAVASPGSVPFQGGAAVATSPLAGLVLYVYDGVHFVPRTIAR